MIKFIAAAIWICVVTIGAVFYSFQSAGARSSEEPLPLLGGLDYVKTEIISIPLLKDSKIAGYFLTRLVYTVEAEMLAKLSVPADAVIVDEVYTYLYSNPAIDFSRPGTVDLEAFRASIRDSINARVEAKLVHDVLIEQIDFLSKEEIRDNTIRRKKAAVEGAPPEPAEPAPLH